MLSGLTEGFYREKKMFKLPPSSHRLLIANKQRR